MVTLYVFIIALTEIALSESKQHIPFIKKKEKRKTASKRLLPYSATRER